MRIYSVAQIMLKFNTLYIYLHRHFLTPESYTYMKLVLMTGLVKYNSMLLKNTTQLNIKSYSIGSLQHDDKLLFYQLHFVKPFK